MSACKICGNTSGNKTHTAREMMFGLRDKFEYLECGNCGCVQSMNVPADMAKYCAANYYCFHRHGCVMLRVGRRWAGYAIAGSAVIGWFVTELICPNNAMTAV